MNIKIRYELPGTHEQERVAASMRSLLSAQGIHEPPQSYVDGLKALIEAYGFTVDTRPREMTQETLFVSGEKEKLGALEKILDRVGAKVEQQNEYKASGEK